MDVEVLTTISPTTNEPVLTRKGLSRDQLAQLTATASQAFAAYRKLSLSDRQSIITEALRLLSKEQDALARELTEQMGRPIAYTAKEISTAVSRGEYLVKISQNALKETAGEPETGFKRYITKEPVGTVLIIFAWNVRTSYRPTIHFQELM